MLHSLNHPIKPIIQVKWNEINPSLNQPIIQWMLHQLVASNPVSQTSGYISCAHYVIRLQLGLIGTIAIFSERHLMRNSLTVSCSAFHSMPVLSQSSSHSVYHKTHAVLQCYGANIGALPLLKKVKPSYSHSCCVCACPAQRIYFVWLMRAIMAVWAQSVAASVRINRHRLNQASWISAVASME